MYENGRKRTKTNENRRKQMRLYENGRKHMKTDENVDENVRKRIKI